MGAGSRAGWYSYDFLDNGRHPSAMRLVPELQHIKIGTVFPALPGVTDGFTVLAFDPTVADSRLADPDGKPLVTWAFVLVTARRHARDSLCGHAAARRYRFMAPLVVVEADRVLVHFVMQRKQLLGIVGGRTSNAKIPVAVTLTRLGRHAV